MNVIAGPDGRIQLNKISGKGDIYTYQAIDTGKSTINIEMPGCKQPLVVKQVQVLKAMKELKLPLDDTILCAGDRITISAPAGFNSYQWENELPGREVYISAPGLYKLQATSYCSTNTFFDSLRVNYDSAVIANIAKGYELCDNDSLILSVPPNTFSGILWSTGIETGNAVICNPGNYWVKIETKNKCSGKADFDVKAVSCQLFVPTAFTPDNNGLNERFGAVSFGTPSYFSFRVWNRYGQQVFSSVDISNKWDGIYNGITQPSGNYIWECQYRFAGRKMSKITGTTTLIR